MEILSKKLDYFFEICYNNMVGHVGTALTFLDGR